MKIKIYDEQYEIDDSPEARDEVFNAVVKFMTDYGVWGGEAFQSDDPIIYAPECIADIVDNILKPKQVSGD